MHSLDCLKQPLDRKPPGGPGRLLWRIPFSWNLYVLTYNLLVKFLVRIGLSRRADKEGLLLASWVAAGLSGSCTIHQ